MLFTIERKKFTAEMITRHLVQIIFFFSVAFTLAKANMNDVEKAQFEAAFQGKPSNFFRRKES